jgi:hypothetical protein
MDISQFYVRVNATHEQLKASKARRERPWESDDFVYLISQNQADLGPAVGGRDNVAVMVLLEDRAGNKRASLALNEPGRPFRLSTAADLEPDGPIAESLRIQSENLAARRLADAKADKTRPFLVQIPGSEA